MKNYLAAICKMLGICGFILSGASFLQHLTLMSFEAAILYMGTIGVGIATVISSIRLKEKKVLVLGFWLFGWGLITATYSTYQGMLLSFVKIAPIAAYLLWIVLKLENKYLSTSEGDRSNLAIVRYSQLFAVAHLVAWPTLVISIIYFSIFNETIPKVQRGHALLGFIESLVVVLPCCFFSIIYGYLFKKIHDFAIILFAIILIASFAIFPAIRGFGWIYALIVGPPLGIMVYYGGKWEQERWIEKRQRSQDKG